MHEKEVRYNPIIYLGDGVYLGKDDIGRLWLYTYDGVFFTNNNICLKSETIHALLGALKVFKAI